MIYKSPPSDFKPKFQIAFCICEYENEILLLQRQDNKGQASQWGVPAGKLEKDELPNQAAKRELYEETNLNLSLSKFKFIDKVYDRYPTFDFTVNIFHVALDKREQVKLNPSEHKSYVWVSVNEALKLDYMQDLDVCLKLYYR